MGIVFRQSLKGTIYVYIGVLLGFITTAILFPRIYTTEQVGLLKVLVAYSTLLAQLGTLGITGVTILLFPHFRDNAKKHHGFLLFILLVGLLGFCLIMAFRGGIDSLLIKLNIEKSELFIGYIKALYFLVFFQIFFSILDAYYSSLFNSVYGAFLKEVVQRILIIIAIGLFFLNLVSFRSFVLLYITAISFPTVMLVIRLVRDNQFSLKAEWGYFNKGIVRQILSISVFNIINGLSMIIIQNVDLLMVNSLVGISAAGVYSICFFFGIAVSLPARSIIKISNVVASDAWKNNDRQTLNDIYYKSCLNLFIIGFILFLGLWVNIENIFHILGNDYRPGKWVIFFIGLSSLIDMATGANNSIMGTSKYYWVQTIFIILLVIMVIVSNILLIPIYGISGAALGSAISLSVLNLLRFLFLYFKFDFQPYNRRFPLIIIIGVVSYIIAAIIPRFSNFIVDIAVRSSVLAFLYGSTVYFLKVSDDINQKTDKFLQFLRMKIGNNRK